MSMFDKDAFLAGEVAEANATRLTPIPVGERMGVITKLDLISGTSKKTGNSYTMLEVTFTIDDEEARETTGMKEPKVRYKAFLEIDDDGNLETGEGKNVQLGKLRAALGQNEDGVAWSPNDMIGQPALLDIFHEPNQEDPEIVYANIKSVTSPE